MNDFVISGIGDAGIGYHTEFSALELIAQSTLHACADAGIPVDAIDGVCVSKTVGLAPGDRPALEVAEYLGLRPSFIDTTLAGGAAPLIQIQRACLAIEAGMCSRVLVAFGSTQASSRQRSLAGHVRAGDDTRRLEQLAGLPAPIGIAALAAARFMSECGLTPEQLASVAVAQRRWAQHHPQALRRDPITIADVLGTPYVASPLHREELCMVSNGAGAVIVERAPGATAGRGVRILGYGEAHSHFSIFEALPLTSTVASTSSAAAFAQSGLSTDDVDVVQIYDAFAILPPVLLSDIGFCERGEVGEFIQAGETSPGGSLPMNTQGGGLSHCHPGVYGLFLVIEAVRQLRGEALGLQVSDAGVALCQGSGGGAFGGSQATVILGAA